MKKPLLILLEALASQSNEGGRAYTDLRNSLVRYFQIKGDFDADEAADVVLDRVGLKLSQNIEIKDLTNYSFGVAKFVFFERLRIADKNKKAQTKFYEQRETTNLIEPQDDFFVFRECLNKLSVEEKKIMKDYFADLPFAKLILYREKLCVEKDVSISNLRVKIFRLKQRLEDCVKKKTNKS